MLTIRRSVDSRDRQLDNRWIIVDDVNVFYELTLLEFIYIDFCSYI